MNPTFHCQSARSHHLLHQSGSFLNNGVLLINKYHCNKNGVKRPSSWSDTPFWPIFLRELTKGVPKRWKTKPSPSKPRTNWYHKGSPPVFFWDEKRSCLGRGGLLCGNSVPKFELNFCPDHWSGPFGPKLHEPSSYIIQT